MATRATYEIDGTTFYIHHDGYPYGGARYFEAAQACKQESPNATLKDAFIRANYRAEIVGSHEEHGDTEFRYTVIGTAILVDRWNWDADAWEREFFGTLADFIAKHPAQD